METVLLYQIKGTKTAALLKPVLLKLGIRVRIVEPEQYLQSIGFLAGNKAFAESPEAYDGAGLIYGMGHAVYTKSDPRAVILKANAKCAGKMCRRSPSKPSSQRRTRRGIRCSSTEN